MLSELYSSVVGDQERLTKLPLVVARDMEERFIRDGWPVGKVYGSEADMAAYYGVGRDVMREAVRVLEARDEVRVRRGPQGGIAVARPGGTHLLVMIGGYAYLTGLGLPDIVEAWSAVHISAVRLIGDRSRQAGGRPIWENQAADDGGIPDTAGLLGRFA
ncbi:FadR/GntR family transcriptional regulator, partial [Streptomyces neyagawaensis]